jgi:hypothetical protein
MGMEMPERCSGKAVTEKETAVWLCGADNHANEAESADPVTASITQMRVPV